MTPYKQLFPYDPKNGMIGDCYRTAIGCLLDMPPQDVPHFIGDVTTYDEETDTCETGDALPAIQAWLRLRGLCVISIGFNCEEVQHVLDVLQSQNTIGWYCLLGGKSSNGTDHVVVCKDGYIVHDPSLTDSGIVGKESDGYFWVLFLCGVS